MSLRIYCAPGCRSPVVAKHIYIYYMYVYMYPPADGQTKSSLNKAY